MAALIDLFKSRTDPLRNRITAAGWNKAKEILVSQAPTPTALTYASTLLEGGPSNRIVNGVLVLLQDDADPDDAAIQGGVDTVVDKLIEAEG